MTEPAAQYVSKDEILADALLGEDLEVPGLGVVRVKGLNRVEAIAAGRAGDSMAIEAAMLAAGLVEPALTAEEAAAFQRAKPAKVVEIISDKITELSGLGKRAAKAAYKSVSG